MKKIIAVSFIFVLLLGLVACGKSDYPEEPTSEAVLRDVQESASNVYVGTSTGQEEQFLLSSLIIDEGEVKLTKGKENIDAEITAFVGDREWKSEVKQTVTLHYGLNASKQWEVQGVQVNDPVIRVNPRTEAAS